MNKSFNYLERLSLDNIFKKLISALSRGITVLLIGAVFMVGMVGAMLIFLTGSEVVVPEIVGRNYVESEDLLSDLGLRIKRRAERYSEEKPGTVLEQIPKAGETVKTGQMILVVVSKSVPDGDEKPATLKKAKDAQPDDSDKIEELILDRPKPSPTATPSPTPDSEATEEAAKTAGDLPAAIPSPATASPSPASEAARPASPTPRVQ